LSLEYARIKQRIEGEAKSNKRSNLEALLSKKILSVRYPVQELELNYPTTKGRLYSEEEDRYLLCRCNRYGMTADDVYERIKKDITEFPALQFDWFLSPQELQRRCNTLLKMIEKEAELEKEKEAKNKPSKGKVCFFFRLPPCIVHADMNLFQKSSIKDVDELEKKADKKTLRSKAKAK
jgi:SWI/SNF-related matrix-associated actin-dependent regulator of chromatin subfamily A member 5